MDITLYTFPVSHFAEKVRWFLDYSDIPYQAVNWVPLVHAPAAYLKSGKRTVPFIEVSDGGKRFVVHDSTRIIEWIDKRFAQLVLMPDDENLHKAAMRLENQADNVGADVIRYMYAPMLKQPDDFIQVWGWESKQVHQNLLQIGLPVIRMLLHRHFDFSTQGRRAGLKRLHHFFRVLDSHLQDGREFLVGDHLSIADVSVASLLAPIFAPNSHPVYSSNVFRGSLTEQQSEFSNYASLEWMQQLYANFRSRKALKPAIKRS